MAGLPDHDLTDEEKEAVLEYIRENKDCSFAEACEAAGIRRKDFRRARKESQDFDDDVRHAKGHSNEHLVNSFRKLAIEGVDEPLVSAGKLVRYERDEDGHKAGDIVYVKRFSDRLVARGLDLYTPEGKAALANKLGIEISGPDGGPIPIQRGVTFSEVMKVLQAAGKAPAELEAPEGTVEIVDESDEQL